MGLGINSLLKAFNVLHEKLEKFISSQKNKEEAQRRELELTQRDLKIAENLKTKVDDLLQITE